MMSYSGVPYNIQQQIEYMRGSPLSTGTTSTQSGGIGGFTGITFDESSGLAVQAPTVYVKPTVTPVPKWEPPDDLEDRLMEIRRLRDKLRNIPEEYLKKAGLTDTEIAEIRNQSATGRVYYDLIDINRIEGKIATAEALMKQAKAQAEAPKPTPVSTKPTTTTPTTTTPTTTTQQAKPTQPVTSPVTSAFTQFMTPTTQSASTSTSQVVSWASFRQYEAETTPYYADKEAREILFWRAWNLPVLNRLIDAGLSLADLYKLRDNEQLTWREYHEIERKIEEAEKKVGIDPSDAIRKAQRTAESARDESVTDFVGPTPDETSGGSSGGSSGGQCTGCGEKLIAEFDGRCVIEPVGANMARVTLYNPYTRKKMMFIASGSYAPYDGPAHIKLYQTAKQGVFKIVVTLPNGVEYTFTVSEDQVIIADDTTEGGNWWIFLLIGVGILLLILFAKK